MCFVTMGHDNDGDSFCDQDGSCSRFKQQYFDNQKFSRLDAITTSTASITIRLRRDFDRAANRDSGNVHYREADCRPLAHGPHCSP